MRRRWKHGAVRGPRHGELGGDAVGDRDVPLPAQLERRDLHLVLVAKLLAGPQPEPAEVDRRHAASVTTGRGRARSPEQGSGERAQASR